jgi:hypothetical protein
VKLTETEKKCLILAFDRAVGDGEIVAAAGRLVQFWRKRYRDGYELINDLEFLPTRPPRIDFTAKHAAWLRRQSIYGSVVLNFGKHRGKPLNQIPADYLTWILENCCTRLSFSTREAIKNYLNKD